MRKNRERGLSHIQTKAILEYINPNHRSQKEIAQRLGVCPRTLRYWNRDPEFREALDEAMEDLRKGALDSSLFALRIEAMVNMVRHEAQVVENFDIKGAIISLGEKQVLLERKIKENSEEMQRLGDIIGLKDIAWVIR